MHDAPTHDSISAPPPTPGTTLGAATPGRDLAVPLYAVAFLFSVAIGGIATTAMPFAAQRFGAGPDIGGVLGGALMVLYIAACLLFGPFVDRFRVRRVLLAGGVTFVVLCGVLAATSRTGVLIALACVFGLCTVLIWPPLVGWLSYGQHDAPLNRRLGRFNLAWCSGLIVGPFIGGALCEWNTSVAFVAAALFMVAGVVVVIAARADEPPPHRTTTPADARTVPTTDTAPRADAGAFRLAARLSLVCAYIALGLMRFQLPFLTEHLDIRRALFGTVLLSMSLAQTVCFAVLGRTHRWHYDARPLLGAQAVLATATVALAFVAGAGAMIVAALILGACMGVCYSSSLYYGVSSGQRRGALMAIHETLLSIGAMIGAVGGGFLAQHAGLRSPYKAGAAAMVACFAVQYAILAVGAARRRRGRCHVVNSGEPAHGAT